MKYIRIKNNGIIEAAALHMVGASTKRNDASKIGQFGSGNKYALAYFLRNDYSVMVYAGLDEIKIETREESFREQSFNLIYINGEKTSITTEMGKDWEFWQAIREVYCNALDEGGCTMDYVMQIEPRDGETHFYIDLKKDVLDFIGNFDNYFATNKKVLFECKYGRILEKSGEHANIYRKGIKCFNSNRRSMYDYDFSSIDIDEGRLVKYSWEVEEIIWKLIFSCDNEEVIMQILHNCGPEYIEGCLGDISTLNSSVMSDTFRKCVGSIQVAPAGYAGLLKPDEVQQHVIIPTKVFKAVRGVIPDDNVGDNFKVGRRGSFYREIESSELHTATLREADLFFKEVGLEIAYPVVVAIFDDKNIMGYAATSEQKIIVADTCVDRGTNFVVNTIIEEMIHLKHGVQDETRAFQDAIITEFITYMKKVNSYAL